MADEKKKKKKEKEASITPKITMKEIKRQKTLLIWAAVFFAMMLMGPIGMASFPPEYFGIGERFSIYSAIGFEAVLGLYLFNGFKGTHYE